MIRIEMDPGIGGKMDRIGRAINKALVFTLTDSATFAKNDLLDALRTKVDRPAPFTLNKSGYGVVPARFGSADLFSEMAIKPAQSAYERFIFESGGVRGLGAAGASKRHVWVPGQRTNTALAGSYSVKPRRSPYGGVPNSYSNALYDVSKKDFAMTLRTAGVTTGKAAYSQGGVFYGTIKGKTGFWARPKRTVPVGGKLLDRAQKFNQQSYRLGQRDARGRFITTGRGALDTRGRTIRTKDVRVVNKGVPILLLMSETATKHHQIIAYAAIMKAAHERSIAMAPDRIRAQLAKA
jgi:hypothetical protein